MTQYEYAVFTVHVHFTPDALGRVYTPPDEWPDRISQAELIERMNELGAQGWEVFERSQPTLPPGPKDETYPYNLWARRQKS